jgi:hypothetical protein
MKPFIILLSKITSCIFFILILLMLVSYFTTAVVLGL